MWVASLVLFQYGRPRFLPFSWDFTFEGNEVFHWKRSWVLLNRPTTWWEHINYFSNRRLTQIKANFRPQSFSLQDYRPCECHFISQQCVVGKLIYSYLADKSGEHELRWIIALWGALITHAVSTQQRTVRETQTPTKNKDSGVKRWKMQHLVN